MADMGMELLTRHFKLDEANKIFSTVLRYESAGELVDERISTPDNIALNADVSDTLLEYLNDIPKGYKCDIDLRIIDYEGYHPAAFLEAFQHMIAMGHVRYRKERQKQRRASCALLCVGIVFLVIMALAAGHILFQNETADEIAMEILDIAGWVFIWEAFTVRFLTPSDIVKKGVAFLNKIHSVSFSDQSGNKLQSCSHDNLFHAWESNLL